MSNLNSKLQQVVERTYRKLYEQDQIMPVKTSEGILVGNVLIVSVGHVKNLYQNNILIYKEVSLNVVAIKIANILTKNGTTARVDALYRADQDYGRWLQESQFLRHKYQIARKNGNNDRADIYLARYCTARDKVKNAQSHALALAAF
jgi:hypothetical protein